MEALAIAHSNTALVKYWGKLDPQRNIPAVGSISVTLLHLWTRTTVQFHRGLSEDRLFLNGSIANSAQTRRTSRFLDVIRELGEIDLCCEVSSTNNFPTAAGLASSASGYAALAMAASHASGLDLQAKDLSALTRLGSGSASRSIFGGFVELTAGLVNGEPPAAVQITDENYWPLSVLVVVTSEDPKPISSREAMAITQIDSPYYRSWVDTSSKDVDDMKSAIRRRNLESVGAIAEHSALKLHGMLMASQPGILYWNSGTVEIIREILRMREEGLLAYFTIDAGPQVKTICRRQDQAAVSERLRSLPGIKRIIHTRPGPSARILES